MNLSKCQFLYNFFFTVHTCRSLIDRRTLLHPMLQETITTLFVIPMVGNPDSCLIQIKFKLSCASLYLPIYFDTLNIWIHTYNTWSCSYNSCDLWVWPEGIVGITFLPLTSRSSQKNPTGWFSYCPKPRQSWDHLYILKD